VLGVRTPGWVATLKDEIFRVNNILTGLAGGGTAPVKATGRSQAQASPAVAAAVQVQPRVKAPIQKRKETPRPPLADPSTILACKTRRDPNAGECKRTTCSLSHVCLSCGKDHSADACARARTWDEVKAAGAYVAQKAKRFGDDGSSPRKRS
jgi:hypothetical protein